MSARKIIDPKQNGEKVWLKGHAQAIYMSDGSTVEDAINSIEIPSLDEYVTETELNDKGFLTEHQDISHLASRNWVESQGYAHQEDLLEISFNDIQDSPISIDDSGMINFVDESGNVGFQINEEGLRVTDVIAGEHKLSQKANASDIPSLDGLVKEENLPNFDEFAKTSDIPSVDGYVKFEDIPEIPSLDEYATKEWVNNKNYATEYELKTIDYSSINNTPTLEDETGELNITDENGNIGMKVSSEAVYAKDFIAGGHKLSEKINKDYVDNSIAELVDGAPETLNTLNELAAALKDNADIVDVLNQSISSKQDTLVSGTNIKTINGTSILGSGDIEVSVGGTQVQSDWNETDTTSPAYIANKPPILYRNKEIINQADVNILSGCCLRFGGMHSMYIGDDISQNFTFKNEYGTVSLKTTGNGTKFLADDGKYKEISGGSSAYPLINHVTSDTTFTLTPNTFHVWDEVRALTLTLGSETSGVANEYLFQFTSGTEPTVLTLPDSIAWANDEIPEIESNWTYQVSVLKGFATLMKFGIPLIFPYTVNSEKNNLKLYNYLISKYNLTNHQFDSPNYKVVINETIIVEDNNYGGEVLGVSLYNNMILLWTENAIESYWGVGYININGNYNTHIWD